jgi:hypothetical protein
MITRSHRFALALAGALAASCAGAIDDGRGGDPATPPPPGTPGSPPGNPGMPPGMSPPGTPPGASPPTRLAPGALRRLTVQQYTQSVRDLLGATIKVPPLEPDPSDDDEFVFTSVATAGVSSSPRAIDLYDAAAREVARQAFADPARRQQVAGCDAATAGCAERFLGTFGQRVWRRPLTSDEIARYARAAAAVAASEGNPWAGLEAVTAALFASPSFLYRVELGAPAANQRKLSDHEVATRLSYTLWDTTPDAALLDAAGRGDLVGKPDVLRAQIDRLLASSRARAPALSYFAEWLGTAGLDSAGLAKDAAAFPQATRTLATAMYKEVEAMVGAVVDGDVDVLTLLDTRQTVLTAELAKVYGMPDAVPAGAASAPVTLPDGPRGGVFGTGAFLALNARASSTSPTLRGQFVRERLLCQRVPPPPPNVDTTIPPSPAGMPETMRERLARHSTDPGCAGCHHLMDPLGLALENFDALGAFRTTDVGKPIDARGELDGRSFDGPAGLRVAVREHARAPVCAVAQLARHLTGSGDDAVAESLAAQLAPLWKSSGGRWRSFLGAALASELLRTVEAAP